ncbi:MFS transporter [Streptomyces sp. NPDC058001]|uniref:MFS transporter n=1 Tax=Streptomyces sp. NPDC058001 TaxID=3346300 RepID=UPI0036DFDAE8
MAGEPAEGSPAAVAPGMEWLIVARLVQGVGAAAMFTTTLSLISTLYSGRRLGLAFGVWAAVASSTSALGPILGGLLTQALDWRWIFYVNVPVTAVALAMTFRCIPRSTPNRDTARRLHGADPVRRWGRPAARRRPGRAADLLRRHPARGVRHRPQHAGTDRGRPGGGLRGPGVLAHPPPRDPSSVGSMP